MSRIFLVDDDVDLAELVRTKLIAEGHQVTIINSGEGAFEMAKQVKPDIVILDIMLPGVTGYQICRRFRKDPELYRVAVLILTALGEEPEVIHGLEQGADDYLVKPFKLERLMDKLSSLAALLQSIDKKNPISGLPGTDSIKREINHRLARGTAIATIYIDMVGFKAYCASRGQDGQVASLRHMARMLTTLARNIGIYESYIAHLGGEHFVVLLNLEDYDRFCTNLIVTFDQSVSQLYSPQEVSQGFMIATDRRGTEIRCPLMALSVGVTHTQFRQFKSAKKMFEVLAQVRQMAQPDGKSVVFVDRRRTDR
jgi:DNA-binding response OmpR family regulator